MRIVIYKHTLAMLLLFASSMSFAQKKYDTKATASEVLLEGKSLYGYKTAFAFQWEQVRKGWWQYARKFGTPLNMKTYYKVTIPAENTDGNVDMVIYTQSNETSIGAEFFLGLENEKYKDQALAMILDFKKEFYIADLISQIEGKQSKADGLSNQYRDAVLDSKKKELLDQLNEIELEIEQLKAIIKTIEKS